MHAVKDLEHRKELFAVIDNTPARFWGLSPTVPTTHWTMDSGDPNLG
jgi:hypothetical protein